MRPMRVLSDVPVSRNWYKAVLKLDQNLYICKILYKIYSIKQIIFNKYATNLKTTISQRSLRNSRSLLFFNLIIFYFQDIIDNIIYASRTCHRNSNQWLCNIIVTCLRLYHFTSILHCHWWEFWSRDTEVCLTYKFWYDFDTVLCQFFETGTSHRCLTGIVQLLRFSVFSLYPFYFSFTVT